MRGVASALFMGILVMIASAQSIIYAITAVGGAKFAPGEPEEF